MDTHLNCIDIDAIQMATHKICLYKVDKKYTDCNPKTTALLGCALTGVCGVIRSNTVCSTGRLCLFVLKV